MKYKIGDKVRVKSLEWYINNYDICGTIIIGNHIFTTSMLKHCESIVTIDSVCVDSYLIKEDDGLNGWTDDMFEGLAEEGIYDEEFKNAINDAYNACLDDKDDIDPLHELCQSKTSTLIIDSEVCKDEVELILNDYEVVVRGDKTYAVKKKPKYPKSYYECCKVLDTDCTAILRPGYKYREFENFQKLLICRDAYWKIAGEQMGLDKSWEFENPAKHYVFTIEYSGGKILLNAAVDSMWNRILVFPTKEMRDAFYKNFKDLIEKCKYLI